MPFVYLSIESGAPHCLQRQTISNQHPIRLLTAGAGWLRRPERYTLTVVIVSTRSWSICVSVASPGSWDPMRPSPAS
jgi:hypothetical protein